MSGIFDQIINYTPPVLGGAGVVNAGSLTGTTLAANVTASSLTSLGTIANLTATAGTIATTPSSSTDIANKLYVDTIAQGLDAKASCRVATTANITLSGTQTIDGISVVAGNRVLVKNQTLSQHNGIYICDASTWTRSTDANTWDSLVSLFVFVERGTVNADSGYVCTVDEGGTLGTTAVTFVQFSSAGSFSAGNGLTLTGSQFSLTAPVSFENGGTNSTSAPQSVARSMGFTSTATAAGTTALTNTSTSYQLFTGTTTQTVTLPVTSTLERGWVFHIINNSTGVVTVNSSGANLVASIPAGVTTFCTCIGTTLTTAADWEAGFTDFSTLTGTGSVVLNASPALSGTITGTYTLGGAPTIAPTLRSSGSTPYLTFTTPADTNRTASTESIGFSLTAATRQWATGALTLQRERVFAAPTYSFVGASTLTTAINVDIADPIQGTNATLTNIFGLRFNRGQFTNQLVSTVATGTAPFVVASTTNIPNLNASSLNGATFAAPGAIGGTTPSAGAFTTLSATSGISSESTTNAIYLGGIARNLSTGSSAYVVSRVGNSSRHLNTAVLGTSWSGTFLTGGPTSESAALYTDGNIPLSIGINNAEVVRFSSTGVAVTGTLSATGQFTGQTFFSIGGSSTDYPSSGYNFTRTASAGVYNYTTTDFSSRLEHTAGGFKFFTAPSGTAGNAITFTERANITTTGLAVTGTLTTSSTTLHTSSVALTNGAGSSAGTLTNAPSVGNPTKWIPIVDNGTTRYIPCW